MSVSAVAAMPDAAANDNSLSTKEFLHFERTCEAYKDCDEEIKMIFTEINKLSGTTNKDSGISSDVDDVELILKKAEDIAFETEILLKSSPVATSSVGLSKSLSENVIPQIKVTTPVEYEAIRGENKIGTKVSPSKQNSKDNTPKRKPKSRPFSAGVIDSKEKEAARAKFISHSTPKKLSCKHETLIEELKNTNERVKSIELLNVQLNDDNKTLRKKLDHVNEQKHLAELKLVECEKYIGRLGKEYENRNSELKTLKENEGKMLADLNKERNERKNLTIRHDKDAVVIQDLQRQVKEMEMILRRKHPDSVSALIVAAKSSSVEDNKKKLLEERINRLEVELKDKEKYFQEILLTLREKLGDMKQKYEHHIVVVERQLMDERKVNADFKNKLNKQNLKDAAVQTLPKFSQNVTTQTFLKPNRASSAVSRMSQSSTLLLNKLKEDSYLVATIKGLQAELTVKQRTISKINRETEELKKNLRNLQKEKEVLLNINPQKKQVCKQAKSTENILARMNSEMEAELSYSKNQQETLMHVRNSLFESLKRSNEELIMLKKKRIQDLHTLQLSHEKELMQMNMQIYPLQEEIKLLNRTVEILQDRVRSADDKLLRYQAERKETEVHAGGDNHGVKICKKISN